ncbi:cupin domain-containing protein [Aquabacter cavernae]|uniref:cupin domain-containing protein n=1 Tax=Aquabacter cavernae TaxID=2496029 RepID=UPI000F8DCDF1|nr:cupin domain-containing protein [Aquabacter cavernae]
MTQAGQKPEAEKDAVAGGGIGPHLRLMRRAHGLRLKELADRAGCSEGLLSRIENNKVEPSLRMLQRICAALNLKVADLLHWSERPEGVVARAADRRPVQLRDPSGAGAEIERLSQSGRLMMAYLNRLACGASTGEGIAHPGEEFGYVLRGRLELVIDGVVHPLEAGDSFSFPSDLSHTYRNPFAVEAEFLIVNAPPSF